MELSGERRLPKHFNLYLQVRTRALCPLCVFSSDAVLSVLRANTHLVLCLV